MMFRSQAGLFFRVVLLRALCAPPPGVLCVPISFGAEIYFELGSATEVRKSQQFGTFPLTSKRIN